MLHVILNKVVAKCNFKASEKEELKDLITKALLNETVSIVLSDNKAKEKLNLNGKFEIQKSVAGETIAFLSDESPVSVRLIQISAHGIFKFAYVLKLRYL
nr:MAG TPA: hypothetical protein [Caudoviricetes sp.]